MNADSNEPNDAPTGAKARSGRRPERMIAWLSMQWSTLDAIVGGMLLLRPKRELAVAWLVMTLGVACAAAIGLQAIGWLTGNVADSVRHDWWFQLGVVPAVAVLAIVPPIALAGLWLTGRALATQHGASASPLRGRFFAGSLRLAALGLPTTLAAAIAGYGLIALAARLSVGTPISGVIQTLGWALALVLLATWAGPRLLYLPCRVAEGRDASLGATRARLRELARVVYRRNVLLAMLFLLLLGMVYTMAAMMRAADPAWFAGAAGQTVLVAFVGTAAGIVLALGAVSAAWAYGRLTLGESASDKAVAAMTSVTANLAGVKPPTRP